MAGVPPPKEALLRCMEYEKAADYFAEGFSQRLKACGLSKECADLEQKVWAFADSTMADIEGLEKFRAGAQVGENVSRAAYHASQVGPEKLPIPAGLKHKVPIVMRIDFLQKQIGYLVNNRNLDLNNPADQDVLKYLSAAYQDWLYENDFHYHEGVLYALTEADDAGQKDYQKDAEGNALPANLLDVRAKLLDSVDGFQAFCERHGCYMSSFEVIVPEGLQEVLVEEAAEVEEMAPEEALEEALDEAAEPEAAPPEPGQEEPEPEPDVGPT